MAMSSKLRKDLSKLGFEEMDNERTPEGSMMYWAEPVSVEIVPINDVSFMFRAERGDNTGYADAVSYTILNADDVYRFARLAVEKK